MEPANENLGMYKIMGSLVNDIVLLVAVVLENITRIDLTGHCHLFFFM
jgi:hypothetical protein